MTNFDSLLFTAQQSAFKAAKYLTDHYNKPHHAIHDKDNHYIIKADNDCFKIYEKYIKEIIGIN